MSRNVQEYGKLGIQGDSLQTISVPDLQPPCHLNQYKVTRVILNQKNNFSLLKDKICWHLLQRLFLREFLK